MIKSMTGFARKELRTKFGFFVAELRTLNHKYLEITYKLPNSLSAFDDRVKNLIKKRLSRGKIYLNLVHEADQSPGSNVFIDEKMAGYYCNKLKKLKKKLKVEGSVKMADIMSFPGVVNSKLSHKNTAKMWPSVKEVIDEALKELIKDRAREGTSLAKDVKARIKKVKEIVSSIKKDASSNVHEYREKLQERIKEISGGYPVDKGRLEVEVALFAKNSDITEELTRLDNHISNFITTLQKKGEIGKKLDFIAQELHREINTVGSKSSGFNISKGVIEIKTEIEKIREQLKNIE